MNLSKRLFVSLTRNKLRTIVMFLIVFLLANFIASSYAITQSTNNVSKTIKQNLAGIISIHEKAGTSNVEFDEWRKLHKVAQIFEGYIKNNDEIAYADVTYKFNFGFDWRLLSEVSPIIYRQKKQDRIISKDEVSEFVQIGSFNTIGVNQKDFSYLYNNEITIVEGRNFTEEEIREGKKVILLSKNLSELIISDVDDISIHFSGFEIGDKIPLGSVLYEWVFTRTDELKENYIYDENELYEVIGFFESNLDNINDCFHPQGNQTYNLDFNPEIFVPINSIICVKEKNEVLYKYYSNLYPEKNLLQSEYNYYIDSMVIYPNSAESNAKIKNELLDSYEKQGYDWINILTSVDAYKLIAGPIESLSEIASIIIWISIIVSTVILSLVIFLVLRDRKHEIGILLSLGEKKIKIIAQIFLEIYVIGLFAIALSFPSGLVVGEKISEFILDKSVKEQSNLYSDELGYMDSINKDGLTIEKAAEDLEIKFTFEYVLVIYTVSSLVIVVSTLIPMRNILNLDPKEIMFN